MGDLTNSNIQEALDVEISKEIVSHAGSGRVIALKTWRNEYCPINRLPEETLLHILLLVKLLIEKLHGASYGSIRQDWFAITRVCSSWRNLVMNCPHFWTLIDTASPHVHRMLSLAKGAPLEVKLHELLEASFEDFWVLAIGWLRALCLAPPKSETWISTSHIIIHPNSSHYPLPLESQSLRL
ncbi:hypothetical protein ONZ45_g19023 [Pleurotus djamor]|nr:hypothetical protein ONZ45_g19023 [Pleurotus djamor]